SGPDSQAPVGSVGVERCDERGVRAVEGADVVDLAVHRRAGSPTPNRDSTPRTSSPWCANSRHPPPPTPRDWEDTPMSQKPLVLPDVRSRAGAFVAQWRDAEGYER